ncbi:hypothetical protein [Nocardia stercoris]|uniref:Uncharacterized protein n=1 Tax=Nocardia stercoris TaxID=2483361 RepID=A0A3M2L6M4_9NOCA|nr:hypothetical protein [Nocardia stercoris]RMI33281.1 hypothetical protein EBN03_08850 [Nocardia stercoris]
MESTASHPILSIGRAGRDSDLAPLGLPALILGVIMLIGGAVGYRWLDDLIRMFGPMVDLAYLAFLGVGAGVSHWGLVVVRSGQEPVAPTR